MSQSVVIQRMQMENRAQQVSRNAASELWHRIWRHDHYSRDRQNAPHRDDLVHGALCKGSVQGFIGA